MESSQSLVDRLSSLVVPPSRTRAPVHTPPVVLAGGFHALPTASFQTAAPLATGGVLAAGKGEDGDGDGDGGGFSAERAVSDALATVQSSSPSCEFLFSASRRRSHRRLAPRIGRVPVGRLNLEATYLLVCCLLLALVYCCSLTATRPKSFGWFTPHPRL